MRNSTTGQVFKGLFVICGFIVLLTGCVTSNPYQSPWALSSPTTEQEKALAKKYQPIINWRTHKKRESLRVYYNQSQIINNKQNQAYKTNHGQSLYEQQSQRNNNITRENLNSQRANNKKITVALLLPMSGKYKNIGDSMMNAAQMALFDLDSKAFRLLPKDTKGTVIGARQAALEAAEAGADLILGPVFSDNVEVVKSVLAYTNIPIISYTTNWKIAGNNTYVMGFLPFSQVIRVVNYARSRGYSKTGFFGPGNDYSNIVLRTLHYSLRKYNDNIVKIGKFSVGQPDLHLLIQDFIGVTIPDDRKSKRRNTSKDVNLAFDSVLIPVGGQTLKSVTNMFGYYNIDKSRVRFLGTGLWDDTSLSNEQTLSGSWFAAPDPNLRADFENRYRKNYNKDPERLASLAYDSLALAIVLAKTYNGIGEPYARNKLVTEQGYAGIDGIFRFRRDNLVERGLAVLEVRKTGLKVIDPAPEAFFVFKTN